MEWTPLTDHWNKYQAHLEKANDAGLFDDPIDAQEILYPAKLHLGEGEKEDIRSFITDRLNELYYAYMTQGEEFNPSLLGTYIFRSILLGMMWEQERIG